MDDEEYWNYSEGKAKAMTFEDDVLSPQEILAIGKTSLPSTSSDNGGVLSFQPVKINVLPISSLVSPKVLDLILLAHSGKDPLNKQTNHIDDSVSTSLRRLVLGRTCSLYHHKSLKAKTELLDGAVLIGDGNVILTVVLFLIQTLKKKLVVELLSSRPTALNHYISFLSNEGKIGELTDLLTMLGRSPEAAIYQFDYIVKHQGDNIDGLLRKLNNALSNHFEQPAVDQHTTKMVSRYIKLLEWQKCVGDPALFNKSVLQCLWHCCSLHWNEGAGKMMSPLTLCQQQQISPMQYDWVALSVHAKNKNWDIVESLFTKKDWLGRSTTSSNVPLQLIIGKLHELKASNNLLARFIWKLNSAEQRLEIAKQFKVHSVVIELLAKQRDRAALVGYQMSLGAHTEEHFLAESTLRDPTIKWKN